MYVQWTTGYQYIGGRNHVFSLPQVPSHLADSLVLSVQLCLLLTYSTLLVSTAPLFTLNFSRLRIESWCLVFKFCSSRPLQFGIITETVSWQWAESSQNQGKKRMTSLSLSLSHCTMLSTWKTQIQVTNTRYKIKCMFPKQRTIIYTAEVLWVFSFRFFRFTF